MSKELSILYVSCVGRLCMTLRVDPFPPLVYEIVGVNESGAFEVLQIL